LAFRPVDPRQSFPDLEQEVMRRWRERDVFHESVRRREGAEPWVFYEGPPTANGRPGSHHVLSRVFKDIYPRYKTMQGHYVPRKGGWDCHGLPVEIAVEKELGFNGKPDIEAYGIEKFNARCREAVFEFLEDWDALTERIGFWVDLDDAYRTLDSTYVESVWWALKQIYEKGLLVEGHKVVPYCARCGTSLSSHEVAQGYKTVSDPSVYVRYPITRGAGPVREGDVLLIWTTTPWTLVSNAAVAVDPETITYVRAELGGETFVLAEALVGEVLGEDATVVERFRGSEFVGAAYEPPFGFIPASEYGEKGHTVLPGDFVTADDGTGIVHTAIAFGEDDYRLGQQHGLAVINPVKLDGTYDERIGPYAGRWVKDADSDLVEDLRGRGRLHREKVYEHTYPHCWRCGTPLLYYAKPSWYIRTSSLRDRLLAANETVDWYPETIKHGRFGNWLENNVDWAISRERYWGTPLPIWRCDGCDHAECLGSRAEVEARSGGELPDPHRPFVDDHTYPCAECESGTMKRVPEVIDVWFDSGCMPFAQHHAPFENEALFAERFPADYICEAIDQTRGWFYSLIAVSTLLFDKAPYKSVVCLGHIKDERGIKMSKSLGNIVDPWGVLNAHGADAFRWYYFTSKQPWDGYLFSVDTVGESVRQFLLQLWNTYGFFALYANANDLEVVGEPGDDPLDRWAISRLNATVDVVTNRLDHFDATNAGRAIAELVDELSNWYVRRSRRRFWDGDPAAFGTLHHCLVTLAQLLAPFCPFVADEIWDNLVEGDDSVHLSDWPAAGPRDERLEAAMAVVRETVELGRSARATAKAKLRQPLRAAIIVADGSEREAISELSGIVEEELNVKALRFVGSADELGSYAIKPNYRTLGPRFGKAMPLVAAAVAAFDPTDVAAALREGRHVGISIESDEHELGPDDLLMSLQPLEGYQVERQGSHAVALELEVDDALRREGLAREIVHAVQNTRKSSGLDVSDRIELALSGDEALLEAAREHEAYIAGEVLATRVVYGDAAEGGEVVTLEGHRLLVAVTKA
jgi:isoleucyl-tRNA synthetase